MLAVDEPAETVCLSGQRWTRSHHREALPVGARPRQLPVTHHFGLPDELKRGCPAQGSAGGRRRGLPGVLAANCGPLTYDPVRMIVELLSVRITVRSLLDTTSSQA